MQKNTFADIMLAEMVGIGCNFLIRFLFQEVISFEFSVVLSYLFGAVTTFCLLVPVFSKTKNSMFKFVTMNIAGLLQTFIVSIWIFAVLESDVTKDVACTTAHSVALGCLVVTNYLAYNKMRPARKRA